MKEDLGVSESVCLKLYRGKDKIDERIVISIEKLLEMLCKNS